MAKNTVVSHLSLDLPKTRIMATIGKSNYKKEELEKMLEAGATIFRFNAARIESGCFDFDDGAKDVAHVLENIKLLSEARRQPITISLDVEGPKVRMKKFISIHEREEKKKKEDLGNHPRKGDDVYLYSNEVDWNDEHIKETLNTIKPNEIQNTICVDEVWRLHTTVHNFETVRKYVSVKDGKCNLRIESRSPKNDYVKTIVEEVASDFYFSPTVGINPKGYMFPRILRDKDIEDFDWALDNDFDLICVSFVCSPLEYFELKKRMMDLKKNRKTGDWHPPLIFAKIETIFSVDKNEAEHYCRTKGLKDQKVYEKRVAEEDHKRYLRLIDLYIEDPIKAICETFDGVMVARGDLAVEADKYHVPFYQKAIIEACRLRNKPVIIATEVLESMRSASPSTRAEIGDIATAILDEADAIMLAGEVASTKSDPASVVKELKTAIQTAENSAEKEQWLKKADDVQYFYEKFSCCLHEGESHLKEMEKLGLLPSENVEAVLWKINIGSRVCLAARAKNASAIFVSVTTGATSKYVSYLRPAQQIISIGSNLKKARSLLLWKGVYPVVMQYPPKHELNDFILIARELHSFVKIKPTYEWKDKEEFIIPALLRIESKLQDEKEKRLLPNTVYDIPLPNPPKGIPEREIKYILNETYYKKLKEHLKEYYKVKEVLQINHYFFDKSGVIRNTESMIRIRIEKVDRKVDRVILTVKKKSEKVNGDTLERWEKEFNVTRYFLLNCSRNHNEMNVSFDSLPEFFRELLWKEFKDHFKNKGIESHGDIEFEHIASMVNTRLTVETHSELILELDAFSTGEDCKYYELEIETIASDEDRRNEYIYLLFKYLGIPVVCNRDYPPKLVRTLIDLGHKEMDDEIRNAIEDVKNGLDAPLKYDNR
jgi:pyruvate kinase/uncharacterized protein YjbK